jgi:hypothetical protein
LGSRNANSRDSVFFGVLELKICSRSTFTDTGVVSLETWAVTEVLVKSTVRTKKKPVKILCIQAVLISRQVNGILLKVFVK